MSLSSSLLFFLNCPIVASSLSDISLIFFPNVFISSSVSVTSYFSEKSSFANFFVILFNFIIGSVIFLETKDAIIADINIIINAININILFDILTDSFIGVTGIFIYKL